MEPACLPAHANVLLVECAYRPCLESHVYMCCFHTRLSSLMLFSTHQVHSYYDHMPYHLFLPIFICCTMLRAVVGRVLHGDTNLITPPSLRASVCCDLLLVLRRLLHCPTATRSGCRFTVHPSAASSDLLCHVCCTVLRPSGQAA